MSAIPPILHKAHVQVLTVDRSIAWHSKSVHLPDPPEKWSCVLFK